MNLRTIFLCLSIALGCRMLIVADDNTLPGKAAYGVYNVKDFGAKGDGVSLDSPSINNAIEAACEAGGGEVIG